MEPRDIVILAGARTPMGRYGGALRELSAIELGALAARGAIERSRVISGGTSSARCRKAWGKGVASRMVRR